MVPIVGTPSQSSDFTNSYIQAADSTVRVVPVILNRHKFKTVHCTAREASSTALNILENLIAAATKQLAEDVLKDILGEIIAANYGAPAQTLAVEAFNYKAILKLREACSLAKMPITDRALIIDDAYYTNLLADEVVSRSFVLPVSQPGIVDARLNRIAGFDVYPTTILPDNKEKLVGFAAHPSGLAIVMRYLAPVADYEEAGAVTDPDSGLTFGYLRYTETSSNRIFITVECLYGFKAAVAEGIRRIVKAA